jgi:polysaccharide biosynthesis transport protein
MLEPLPRDEVRTQRAGDGLRRYWVWILCATFAFGTLAAGYAYLHPHKYRSTATVLVRPLAGNALSTQTNSSGQSVSVAMITEAGLVSSTGVTSRVDGALGTHLKSGDPRVSAKLPENSQVLKITYVGQTPLQGQQRAEAYARAFLEYRSDLADRSKQTQLSSLEVQAAAVERKLTTASAEAAQKNASPEAATMVSLYASALLSLESELGRVQSISTDPGSVVAAAVVPHASAGLDPAVIVGAGLLAGLVVSAGIAIRFGRVDDRIHANADVTVGGVPILGVVALDRDDSSKDSDGGSHSHAHQEGLRRARTGLLGVARPGSVVALAGISGSEPSLTTATDLAGSLATSGYRVTVVDAITDPASAPGTTGDRVGLADLIDGSVPDVLPLEQAGPFRVLRAGALSDAARERLSGREMRVVLERLQSESDYVLVAVTHAASWDGLAVLLAVDKVVLLVTDRTTTHDQVANTAAAVERLGVTTIGVLIQQSARVGVSADRRSFGPGRRRTHPRVPDLRDEADFGVDLENSHRVTVTSRSPW